jgi:hypothetical protein
MYDGLNMVPPEQINNSTVGQYFKPSVLDPVKEDIVRTEDPPQ